jgi:hypothetical protein
MERGTAMSEGTIDRMRDATVRSSGTIVATATSRLRSNGYVGPLLCGVIALCAALPSLAIPFMSDDWINLATVSGSFHLQTAFGYFRPLYLASFWTDLRLWGMQPVGFHATNSLLISACAVMVALVVRRYTGDPLWATVAGILFALHPYHVENVAWIAARADSASTALVLVALLLHEDWARRGRGIAVAAVVAFEAALLFKESVVFFPAMVIVLRAARVDRISRGEWLRGILPLAGTSAAHFFVVRPLLLGDAGLGLLNTLGPRWIIRGVEFCSAALLPFHAERIDAHPILFAGLALIALTGLVLLARRRLHGAAYAAGGMALLFLLGLFPSLISFQERYFLLPSIISCTVLARLLLSIPGRIAPLIWTVMLVTWLGSLGAHWQGWLEAGRASDRLIRGLTEASHRDDAREIVVANQPYRVAGAPIGGDLSAAVRLSGGERVRVLAATSLDLPNASASGIEGSFDDGVIEQPDAVEVRLRLPRGVFTGIFLPLQRPPGTVQEEGYATLVYDDSGGVLVRIPRLPDGSRVAYAWYDGRLAELF